MPLALPPVGFGMALDESWRELFRVVVRSTSLARSIALLFQRERAFLVEPVYQLSRSHEQAAVPNCSGRRTGGTPNTVIGSSDFAFALLLVLGVGVEHQFAYAFL